MKVYPVILAVGLVMIPAGVAAQDPAPLRPNDRLRFTAPSAGYAERVAGTVVEIRDGELHLLLGGRDDPSATRVAVPVSSITRLERSRGRGSHVLHGVLGAVGGAGLGAVGGVLHRTIQEDMTPRLGRKHQPQSYLVESTLAGAAVGLVLGALLPGERWRPLGVPASLFVSGTGPVAALAVRIGF